MVVKKPFLEKGKVRKQRVISQELDWKPVITGLMKWRDQMLLIYLKEVERCTTEQEAHCTAAPCTVAHFIKLLYPSIFLAKDAHMRDGPRLLHSVFTI